jgi:hypothetical protein
MTPTNRAYLPTLLACLILLGVNGAPADAEEPCSNAQARSESNVNPATKASYSTQLPDCRAYELVSPPDTGGFPAVSFDKSSGDHSEFGADVEWDQVTPGGALYWFSRATPAGTGAVPDGGSLDVFVSRRAAGGWTTQDLTPFSTVGENELIAGAPNGSAALIATQTSLVPEDQDNPFNGHTASSFDIYRVSEGEAPLLVSHGSAPRTPPPPPNSNYGLVYARPGDVAFNAQLTAVAFVSEARLTGNESVTADEASPGFADCYEWSDVGPRLASLTNPDAQSPVKRNCELLGMTPDGRPIFKDLNGDSDEGLIFVGNGVEFPIGKFGAVQLSAPTSTATMFDALSPDGTVAYVTTAYPLGNQERGSEPDVYGVNVPAFPKGNQGVPGAGGENTVVCLSCQVGGGAAARFMGQSADGSHVFFNVAEAAGESAGHPYKGLWSWDRNSKTAARLTEATDVEQLVFSENGQYAAGLTKQLANNLNGTADVYELSVGQAPQLITSGVSADTYRLTFEGHFSPPTVAGVSNDGRRVVYDDKPPGGASLETLQEWNGGPVPVQLSPLGATSSYYVLGTAGPELEDVFFAAHEPLVGADRNGGTQDVYDARVQGGFPAPSEPANNNQTPNPIPPTIPGYAGNLAPPGPQIAPLPPDTSHPASVAKPLTRAQRLAKALKACKKAKRRSTRLACEKSAHKKYGTTAKKSAHRKGRK